MPRQENPGKEVLGLARVRDVALMLGVTQKTVRDLVKAGKIQAHRIPKHHEEDVRESATTLFFTRDDVQSYVQWKYGEEDNDEN